MWANLIILVLTVIIAWWLMVQNAKYTVVGEYDLVSRDTEVSNQVDSRSSIEGKTDLVEDDLALIEGIGPVISKTLTEAGIKTFHLLEKKR